MRKKSVTMLCILLAAAGLWGCTGRYKEAAVVQTTEMTQESSEIAIVQRETEAETETETEAEVHENEGILDLSDRTPVDGKVRSYLTGEWVETADPWQP